MAITGDCNQSIQFSQPLIRVVGRNGYLGIRIFVRFLQNAIIPIQYHTNLHFEKKSCYMKTWGIGKNNSILIFIGHIRNMCKHEINIHSYFNQSWMFCIIGELCNWLHINSGLKNWIDEVFIAINLEQIDWEREELIVQSELNVLDHRTIM